jgi:hypothetical protein
MRRVNIWWAVAGGWAIDLWLGQQTRDHHDIEVVVRRDDQTAAWDALNASFQLKASCPSLEFDLFVESASDDSWTFRRDGRVQRAIDEVTTTRSGIRIVDPAVQLLYMAKSKDLKNQHDFEVARPTLDARSATWLRSALALAHPGHP